MSLIKKINLIVFILMAISLIAFDIYKAATASFTHDESYTYLHYVNDSFMNIISYHNPFPNNHILNSLLMKFSQALFGSSELALRLPNILAHILYLIFTFKIFNRYSEKNVILFFILMNANPFLLDFFTLARGYGIAIGLMTSGFYFYCRFLEEQKTKHHVLALSLISLASLANFALLNVVLVFILVHNIFQFFIFKRKFSLKDLWQANYVNVILFFLLAAVCYEPIRKITQLKLIDFGGTNGFWEDTVTSSLIAFSYYSPYQSILISVGKILVIIFCTLFVIKTSMYLLKRKPFSLVQKLVLFFGLTLFLIVLSSVMQHLLLKTPFLMGRFALFLYPIFILMSCFLLADILEYAYKYITRGFLFLLTAFFLLHTFYSSNLSWYYEWQYDMDTKNMLEKLEVHKTKSIKNISLGITWEFEPTINFYRNIHRLDWLNEVNRDGLKPDNDYFYVTSNDFQKLSQGDINIICHYKSTDNYFVEHFKPIYIQLKAANNKYVCADINRANVLIANTEKAWAWETFSMVYLGNDKVVLYSSEGRLFSADLGGNTVVTASRDKIGEWETFEMVKIDTALIAFKATNGKYLSLDEKTLQIFANGDIIGKNEKFKMIQVK